MFPQKPIPSSAIKRQILSDPGRYAKVEGVQDHVPLDVLMNEPEAWENVLSAREMADSLSVETARDDPNAMAEYVFGYAQHKFHVAIQDSWTRYRKSSTDAPVEHGKSTQAAVRLLWEYGQNVSTQAAYIGSSTEIPYRQLSLIRHTIEENENYKQVFPWVGLERQSDDRLILDRPKTRAAHPSLAAMGIFGSIIGGRYNIIFLDDIHDQKNVVGVSRKKIWHILEDVVLKRLLYGGSLWDIGTPWYDDDARHILRKRPGYHWIHFDAEDGKAFRVDGVPVPFRELDGLEADETLWDAIWFDPESGQPYGWPMFRLEETREELSLAAYSRQFRCRTMSQALAVFKNEDMERCLELGRGLGPAFLLEAPPSASVITGVDPATRRSKKSDKCVMTTIYAAGGRVHVVDIRSGHWEQPDIARQVREIVREYPNFAGLAVEDNSAQAYLVQTLQEKTFLRAYGFNDIEIGRLHGVVRGLTTTSNKWDEHIGVRSMAREFEQGLLVLPSDQSGSPVGDVAELVHGLLTFDPDPQSHTSDYVMSLWIALTAMRTLGFSGSGRDYGIGRRKSS